MKRIIITLALMVTLLCMLVISAGAEEMAYYCKTTVTLTDNTQTTVYFPVSSEAALQRDVIYKTIDTSGETLSWSEVKVLDFRDAVTMCDGEQIYNSPQKWLGTSLSGTPSNVTTVYLPETMTYLAKDSFTSDWKALDTVYIPASVAEMSTAFTGSPVKTVVFANGSKLETILDATFEGCSSLSSINLEATSVKSIGLEATGKGAFRGCTSLTTIKFPETLEMIGYNTFYLSGLSGKIVLPNSVTFAGPGAFLSTKIETLILGDGSITIGHNFVGTYNATNNAYLKEIYIPSGATISASGSSSPWYKCANTVTFYVIGYEGENCDSIVSELKKAYGSSYMTIITEEEAKAATEGSYDAVIKLGYNKCDAFYDGEHIEVIDDTCLTKNLCKNCKRVETQAALEHSVGVEIVYDNGFASEGTRITGCTNPNCTAIEEKGVADAIFGTLGYSTSSTNNSISGGYKINTIAYGEYIASGKTLEFGIILVNPAMIAQGEELLENGVLSSEKGIQFKITDVKYSTINFFIHNFTQKTASIELVMTLYTIDESGNVSYIQAQSSYNREATIGTRALQTISLERIIGTEAVALLPSGNDEN